MQRSALAEIPHKTQRVRRSLPQNHRSNHFHRQTIFIESRDNAFAECLFQLPFPLAEWPYLLAPTHTVRTENSHHTFRPQPLAAVRHTGIPLLSKGSENTCRGEFGAGRRRIAQSDPSDFPAIEITSAKPCCAAPHPVLPKAILNQSRIGTAESQAGELCLIGRLPGIPPTHFHQEQSSKRHGGGPGFPTRHDTDRHGKQRATDPAKPWVNPSQPDDGDNTRSQ